MRIGGRGFDPPPPIYPQPSNDIGERNFPLCTPIFAQDGMCEVVCMYNFFETELWIVGATIGRPHRRHCNYQPHLCDTEA